MLHAAISVPTAASLAIAPPSGRRYEPEEEESISEQCQVDGRKDPDRQWPVDDRVDSPHDERGCGRRTGQLVLPDGQETGLPQPGLQRDDGKGRDMQPAPGGFANEAPMPPPSNRDGDQPEEVEGD